MKKNHSNDPIFFQYLNSLIQSIPRYPSVRMVDRDDNSLAPTSDLGNYLNHYSLGIESLDHCAKYEIWQSHIHDYRIVEHRWHAKKPNGHTIILCHGYFDHTLLYGKVIRWALKQGYCLHGFDLPGHGLSSGEPASIDSFDEYSQVLTHIINRERYLHCYCLGQSTGCAVIINALLNPSIIPKVITPKANSAVEKIILLAPLVRSIHWQFLRWPYQLLHHFIHSIKRAFVESSHDKEFNHFLHHQDPLQAQKLPLNWLGAMDEWVKKINNFKPNNLLSCSIIQGTNDNTVDYAYNLQKIQERLPQTRIDYIEGAYHHLANESDAYWLEIKKALDASLTPNPCANENLSQ